MRWHRAVDALAAMASTFSYSLAFHAAFIVQLRAETGSFGVLAAQALECDKPDLPGCGVACWSEKLEQFTNRGFERRLEFEECTDPQSQRSAVRDDLLNRGSGHASVPGETPNAVTAIAFHRGFDQLDERVIANIGRSRTVG